MIRTLLVTSDLIGRGAEREFATLARGLDRDTFQIDLAFWRERFDYAPPPDLPRHLLDKHRPWHLGRTIRRTRELVARLRPDVVFSQLHYPSLVTGTALGGLPSPPAWVCRLVNDPARDLPGPLRWWGQRVFRRAAKVVGCSRGVSEALVAYLGLDPGRVTTLDNLVDVAEIDQQAALAPPLEAARRPGRFVIVMVGTLRRQKRPELGLDVLGRLADPRAELWYVGTGPLWRPLERDAARRGMVERVKFWGFQPRPHPLLAAADCLLLASDSEGLPNAVIEAQLCGVPVVATRCRFGPEELIEHGRTGLLVAPGDAAGLARAVGELARDPARARQVAEAARSAARERFDTRRVIGQYQDLLAEVAAAGAGQ